MAAKNRPTSSQIEALRTTDLSPLIRLSGLMVPRMLGNFLPTLNEKQRNAFNKVMPVGSGKTIYIHLAGTPTPPIVIEFAQPLRMTTMPEDEVRQQHIRGIRLGIEDIQALSERRIGKIIWRLKGQLGTILRISGMFMPILRLGPRELKDLRQRAMTHFKPLLDLMPR